MDFYKYQKYKYKNNQNGGKLNNNNFTFVHNTFGHDNLVSILKSGVIKLGSDVEKERRKLSGGIPMDNIYMNINFDDLNNLSNICGLIFSSKLPDDYDITINAGWGNKKIVKIKSNDSPKKKNNKLQKVKDYLKNPSSLLSQKLVELLPDNMNHEVLFSKEIYISKYLICISLCGSTKKEIKNIKKIIKEQKLDHIKIIIDGK